MYIINEWVSSPIIQIIDSFIFSELYSQNKRINSISCKKSKKRNKNWNNKFIENKKF